jgi:hypothetical protein
MKWKQQISEDVQYILHNFTNLKITCIMLGGSCSWGCANPRDIDYIIYCSNITRNVHRHKKTEGNLGTHMIFIPNNNRYIKGPHQSWQVAEMYMALMQTNTELVLYGQPPDMHCPVDLVTSTTEYMLQDISQCIDNNHIAKHCYIYLNLECYNYDLR